MIIKLEKIQDLLRIRAEHQAKLNLIPYTGRIEVKEISNKKYLYLRKRELGKYRSIYVGSYSDELHQILLKQVKDAKELSKAIRKIDKELVILGYSHEELSKDVIINLDFARANMKSIIYDQAVLEGVSTTFPDTELIIENGKVHNMSSDDVIKIINLKRSWEFILDKDVITSPSSYYVCQYIAKLVNEGFYYDGGKIRSVPVSIGGTKFIPKIPNEAEVKENIEKILTSNIDVIDQAIELALYVMKTQIFIDGNKRTGIIFANHYLISKGKGLLVVPFDLVSEFKKLLISYYEETDVSLIKSFLKNKCWKQL